MLVKRIGRVVLESSLIMSILYSVYVFHLPKELDSKLLPIAKEFARDAAKYGIEVDLDDLRYLGFYDLPDHLGGFGLTPNVLISKHYPYSRGLLYHELAHSLGMCFGHVEEKEDGVYESIMNKYIRNYEPTWDILVEKLFTKDIYEINCSFKGMKTK